MLQSRNSPKSLELYSQELAELYHSKKFAVLLCGPTLGDLNTLGKPGESLRKKLKDALEEKGFDVILGEDDGLEEPRLQYGMDAQENEMSFVKKHCNAIVLIASSIGAYCELGLFSYYKIHSTDKLDFILIISDEHEGKKSYLNLGPATAVEHWGKVYYEDLEKFEVSSVVKRLEQRRAVLWMDDKGRPKRKK